MSRSQNKINFFTPVVSIYYIQKVWKLTCWKIIWKPAYYAFHLYRVSPEYIPKQLHNFYNKENLNHGWYTLPYCQMFAREISFSKVLREKMRNSWQNNAAFKDSLMISIDKWFIYNFHEFNYMEIILSAVVFKLFLYVLF